MNFKNEVHSHCHQLVDERMALIRKLINEAQTAANDDTKSSMGDKYETGREMMALEMRKSGEQLQESSKLKQVLSELNPDVISKTIVVGSFVSTSIGDFYLSVSLGQVNVKGKQVFILSAVSPLGEQLLHKKQGDEFEFNSRTITIKNIA
jgi:transcription elongation GreA/GreB family factor